MKTRFTYLQIWILALVSCVAAIWFSFSYVDIPVAQFFSGSKHYLNPIIKPASEDFASTIILFLEATTILGLSIVRLFSNKKLPPLAEAVGLACLASISVYAIDSNVLKPLFGVPTPDKVLDGARHTFNFFAGSEHSSFPSGHMTLAAPFAGVFMRLYRQSILPLSALLLFGAALLVAGEWHFVSDVIAGTFIGLSAGLLAAQLWVLHSN